MIPLDGFPLASKTQDTRKNDGGGIHAGICWNFSVEGSCGWNPAFPGTAFSCRSIYLSFLGFRPGGQRARFAV